MSTSTNERIPRRAVTGYAIASQDVPVPGSADDTLTVGVHSLTVEGDVQVLRLLLTPHFASVDEDAAVDVRDMWEEFTDVSITR